MLFSVTHETQSTTGTFVVPYLAPLLAFNTPWRSATSYAGCSPLFARLTCSVNPWGSEQPIVTNSFIRLANRAAQPFELVLVGGHENAVYQNIGAGVEGLEATNDFHTRIGLGLELLFILGRE